MSGIPDAVAIAAIETILKPLGTSLRHYMPASKAAAIATMKTLLAAQQQRFLFAVEEVRVSPEWSGQHADWICGAIVGAVIDQVPEDA